MATNEGSENNMEFFFTLNATPELQNTHTIFGKVTGETVYNMLKLAESQVDANERPLYPHKINKIKILHNPFEDLSPRVDHLKSSKDETSDKKKSKREGVKNFKLISFGDEAEQDEQEVESFPKEKGVEPAPSSSSSASVTKIKEEKSRTEREESPATPPPESKKSQKTKEDIVEDSDSDYESTMEKEKLAELERKRKEIQDQIKDIKKQYQKDKKEKIQKKEEEPQPTIQPEDAAIQDYLEEKEKYKKKKLTEKGAGRESFTLSLLAKFKNKLLTAQETTDEAAPSKPIAEDEDDENWLSHKLDFSESQNAVLARDASKKQDDWYDIYDPRNPLNKRKRNAEKTSAVGEPSRKK